MKAKVYSVFPACGKTYIYENQEDYGIKVLDSDSSQFSWLYTNIDEDGSVIRGVRKVRDPEFPKNYIEHIKENLDKYDYIFVSSHREVRDALDEVGIKFTIVYPSPDCKAEWIGRCFIREQNDETGCGAKVMYDNWSNWVSDCIRSACEHPAIQLDAQEHLSQHILTDRRYG